MKGMIKMKKTNKKITMAIGMVLGVTVLTGAALASYSTSNGYVVGKNALKGLVKNENYTSTLNMTMSIDGNEIANSSVSELYDRNGDVKLNKTEYLTSNDSYIGETEYKVYVQDGQRVVSYKPVEEEPYSYVDTSEYLFGSTGMFDQLGDTSSNDEKTQEKIIRFAELIGDTFIGDLKNNFVYVSGDDNGATYEINLDAIQIPEVVNAGLSVMFSSMNNEDYRVNGDEDPFLILGTDPIVKNASLKFSVDSEGRLTNADAQFTMSGDGHEANIRINSEMKDYGTTQPQRVDISTLPNVEYINNDVKNGEIATYTVEAENATYNEDGTVTIEVGE